MTAWIVLALLVSLAMSVAATAGLRGRLLVVTAMSLLSGATCFGLQQHVPATAVVQRSPPLSLVSQRNALLGQFNRSNNWMIIADSFASRGQTGDAAGLLQSAVRAHPRDYALWLALGTALTNHAGRINPAARLAFARSAALAPTSPAPGYFLGRAMLQSGDRKGALGQWRAILAAAPANASWRPMIEDEVATVEGPRRP
ncbi:tetratricopeptide repeat protein [Sphingomonas sp.]|uniref:tetratricopeptide repeat protein n=1 Tax=Sphingomonas sp. TaxID=28214 RepID=UPI00286CB1A2|nr:tetratricopeptide repeat protein [Sphingomonas sp.]